jgi:hypothetical protein
MINYLAPLALEWRPAPAQDLRTEPQQPDALSPALDAPLAAWAAHVRKLSEALSQTQCASDIRHWQTAMSQAAQSYAARRFEPVRDEQSLLANHSLCIAFAMHPEIEPAADALIRLAQEFAGLDVRLSQFDMVDAALLSDFVWAFSCDCRLLDEASAARRELAEEICHRLDGDPHYFSADEKAHLLNGLSCGHEVEAHARQRLQQPGQPRRPARLFAQPGTGSTALSRLSRDDLARLSKSLGRNSKRRENHGRIRELARHLEDEGRADTSLSQYSWSQLADLANGFAKFARLARDSHGHRMVKPQAALVDTGLVAIAIAVSTGDANRRLAQASAIDLSLLVNGFSKLAGEHGNEDCHAALAVLAEEVLRRAQLHDFKAVELSNLVNGFSKLAG